MSIRRIFLSIACLLACVNNNNVLASPLSSRDIDVSPASTGFSISLVEWYDNQAFKTSNNDNANLDGFGSGFTELSSNNTMAAAQLIYQYIEQASQQQPFDNIISDGQSITLLNKVPLGALYMLVTSTHGTWTNNIDIIYDDGTVDSTTLSLPDWQDEFTSQVDRFHVFQHPMIINQKATGRYGALYSVPVYVNPNKVLIAINLPARQSKETSDPTMHVFSITAFESIGSTSRSKIIISSAESTHEWINSNEQVILIRVHNISPYWISNLSVSLKSQKSKNIKTTSKGFVGKIAPGHTLALRVIVHSEGTPKNEDDSVIVTVVYTEKKDKTVRMSHIEHISITTRPNYQANSNSVQQHRPPNWLKQAKFGIFIHYGLYSVPAWAPVGKAYAEWYWWRMNHKDDPAYAYHRQHYGEDFSYDDFLTLWKPTQFNPRAWLDLIDKSGARYYVFTAKHHDGISLFDTHASDRSTTRLLYPNRDFVRELLNVSESVYPHLKRGLYFSVPEWYNPKYKDDSLGWHGPPTNPYTNQRIPYLGAKDINSYINDLQVPQFQELVKDYNPDILWCDIGGINNSTVWQSDYFNKALAEGKQVSVNDRCGQGSASDFTTIEYKSITDIPTRFWEATRGMDPYSFGYNQETKPDEYASTFDLIKDLVDAVSKGGNFLLNIGPESSGLVPTPMSQRLLEIGSWLEKVKPSIFDSEPYWITALEDNGIRFTVNRNGNSVYVFLLERKVEQNILINTPLPIQENSTIILMNHRGVNVKWKHVKHTSSSSSISIEMMDLIPKDINNEVLVLEIINFD